MLINYTLQIFKPKPNHSPGKFIICHKKYVFFTINPTLFTNLMFFIMSQASPTAHKQDPSSEQKIAEDSKIENSLDSEPLKKQSPSVQLLHQTIRQLNEQLQSKHQQNIKLQEASKSLSQKINLLIYELNSAKEENSALKKNQTFSSDSIEQSTAKTQKPNDEEFIQTPCKKLHIDSSIASFSQESLFHNSKIITEEQNKINIQNFLTNKVIKKAYLLYRATDNGFETKKFHEKCNGVSNTLTVCVTQFNKKIGGFTPLSWKVSSINQEWKIDKSKESFLFSLTHNEKFILKDPNRAICNGSGNGPWFGDGPDLVIKHKGNENLCTAEIGVSYKNENCKQKSRLTYERFTGNPNNSAYFKVKDWQVWKLEFD